MDDMNQKLCDAAGKGNLNTVKGLVKRDGCSINQTAKDGNTPLHSAVKNDHRKVIKYLIKHGADVEQKTADGQTPLHLAASIGHLESSKILLGHGANIESENHRGSPALIYAASSGHSDVIQYLISQGAEVNKGDEDGWTALHFAVQNGRIDVTKYLITRGAEVNKGKTDGCTALHIAAQYGHLDVIRYLISHGAEVNKDETRGVTALHRAAMHGYLDVTQYLVSQGAEVNRIDGDDRAALHIAAENKHFDVMKYLISQGANVNMSGKNGLTALHIVTLNGHLLVTHYLISQGADVNKGDKDGWTVIHDAARHGHLDVIKYLISQEADVNKGDNNGCTALHTAVLYGHLDVTKYLISQDVDVNKEQNKGKTALHLAVDGGHLYITQYLISQGAEMNKRDNYGWTALHSAAWKGYLAVTQYLISQGAEVNKVDKFSRTALQIATGNKENDVAQYLISQGAENYMEQNNGKTALHRAAQNGHLDNTQYLISQGAAVDKGDDDGVTALHLAAEEGHLDVAKYLITQGAEVNEGDSEGCTALHSAAHKGHLDVIKYLISQGAHVNQCKNHGLTALHTAVKNCPLNVITCLISHGAEVNDATNEGITALHLAARKGRLDICTSLLGHGALMKADNEGWTPLHDAVQECHIEVVKVLLSSGACLHTENVQGQTPFQLSLTLGYQSIVELFNDYSSSKSEETISTDIHLAIQEGGTSTIEKLVSHGADLNVQSPDGQTCLHKAIILSYKTERNVKETDMLRKISEEVYQGELSPEKALVFYLLENGAKFDVRDKYGNLPIHYAQDEVIKQMILSRLPSLDVIQSYRAAPQALPIVTSVEIGDTVTQHTQLEDHGVSITIPPETFQHSDLIGCKITLTLLRDPPSVDIQDDESMACYGIRCDPPLHRLEEDHTFFHQPVKIEMPHTVLVINPNQVIPDIVSHLWDASKDLPITSRKRSSKSPKEPPYCRVYERHLELYIDRFADWWVLIPLEQQVIRHHLLCTPYVPDTIERGKEIEVHFHVHANVPGMDVEVENEEKEKFYHKAHRPVPFSIVSRSGDVTVAHDSDKKMALTKLSLRDIHSQMSHHVVLPVPPPPSEDDNLFQVITVTVTQAGERGISRSMAFVIRYEDEIKGPEFSPIIREIEGVSTSDLSDVDVIRMAENLSIDDFYDLGVALGFPIAQLDAIEYQRLNDRQQAICDMLIQWKQSQPPGQNTKEMLLSLVKSAETEAKKMAITDDGVRIKSSAMFLKRSKPVDPIEHEDMDIISASYADQDETDKDFGQGGGTPTTEELCSVALPVKNLSLALALGKALRLNDDDIVGFISLPSPSDLHKISRQLMDSWWNSLNKEEKDEHLCRLLTEHNIPNYNEGRDQMSKAICSKTDLLDLCHHLSRTPSDILQNMRTSLTFPPYMIRRSALMMLGEWVRRGGTRVRLLQVVQAFRFNDAAAKTAEAVKCQPGYTPVMSHATIDHKGGELTLEELGITVSIPGEALPKGMRSVVTLQVRSQDTPRIPLQDGDVLISPVVECSLTQELLKPATVVLPHCINRRDLKDDSTVMLYAKTGPGTFGRRKLSSSSSLGCHISKETIKFRTRHLHVWALSAADVIGVHLRCATFQPIFITSASRPSLRLYIVHPFQYCVEVIKKKEKSSAVPYCQVTEEVKFCIDPKAGDLKILCDDGSKKAKRMVPMQSLRNGKCKPLDFKFQFCPEETGNKNIHLTILQGSSTLADKEFTTSIEVEPDYGVDITDSQGRLQYVSNNLLEILSEVIHTPRDVQSLGCHLGFSYSYLEEHLNRDDAPFNGVSRSGFDEMLRDWRRRVRPSEQVDELHLAMKNAGLGHAAEVIMHELSTTSRSHFAQIIQEWEDRK